MQTDEKQTDESLGTQSEIEDLGGCKRRVKATVPAAKVVEELDRNYSDLAQTVQIPGFRKGRVPRRLLESRYGEEIESEVKESIVAASFSEVIEERELEVFSSPKFENVRFQNDSDLTYEVEFEVRPRFELPEYKGVEVAAEPGDVTEEDVAAELEKLRRQMAALEPTSPGDIGEDGYLGGSYALFVDGNEVKKEDKLNFQPASGVLGHFYIEDLSARVAGHDWSSEAPLTFDLQVPSHFPDEVLRGKDARLEVLVTDGYAVKLPDLDDEFARTADHETLEEMKKGIRETLEKRKKREAERRIEDRILDKLADATEIEVPEALIEAQLRRNRMSREQALLEQGLSGEQVEELLAREATAEERGVAPADKGAVSTDESATAEERGVARADERAEAGDESAGSAGEGDGEEKGTGAGTTEEIRRSARKYFILEAIATKEKVFVTEQNLDEKLADMARQYGMTADSLRAELDKAERLSEVRQTLKHEKVRELLRSKAKIIGPEPSPESPPEDVTETRDAGGEGETVAEA